MRRVKSVSGFARERRARRIGRNQPVGRKERVSTYNSKALLQADVTRTMSEPFDLGARAAGDADEASEEPFKVMSREEAQALRERNPSVSPWRVVAAQAAAGLVCGAVTWFLIQRSGAVWSALYGAAAVVVPSALLARGMTRHSSPDPGAALFGFMFWETVKVGVAVAMLVAAPRVVQDLSWPALLVTMVVCVKVNWWALLWRRKPVLTTTT
jgi:ATP synthase protein I